MDWVHDLRQIRAFVAVVEEGSFAQAALLSLHDHQFIIHAKATETYRLIEKWLEAKGCQGKKPLVLGDMQAIKEMAAWSWWTSTSQTSSASGVFSTRRNGSRAVSRRHSSVFVNWLSQRYPPMSSRFEFQVMVK